MTNEMIATLETKGFNRWTKNGKDRMYINAGNLGLECKYHNTGSIAAAFFGGKQISNSEGYRFKGAKTYIDLSDDSVHSDRDELAEAAIALIGEEYRRERFGLYVLENK